MNARIIHASIVLLVTIASLFLSTPAHGQSTNLTIYNETEWTIRVVNVSKTVDDHWGPDRLGTHVLRTGYQFTVPGLACDRYDTKLIDEDGDVCILKDIWVCGRDAEWHFTSAMLLLCEADTRQ